MVTPTRIRQAENAAGRQVAGEKVRQAVVQVGKQVAGECLPHRLRVWQCV